MPVRQHDQADLRTDLTEDCPTCGAAAGWVCRNVFNGRELPAERGTHYARQVLIAEGPSVGDLVVETLEAEHLRER